MQPLYCARQVQRPFFCDQIIRSRKTPFIEVLYQDLHLSLLHTHRSTFPEITCCMIKLLSYLTSLFSLTELLKISFENTCHLIIHPKETMVKCRAVIGGVLKSEINSWFQNSLDSGVYWNSDIPQFRLARSRRYKSPTFRNYDTFRNSGITKIGIPIQNPNIHSKIFQNSEHS